MEWDGDGVWSGNEMRGMEIGVGWNGDRNEIGMGWVGDGIGLEMGMDRYGWG